MPPPYGPRVCYSPQDGVPVHRRISSGFRDNSQVPMNAPCWIEAPKKKSVFQYNTTRNSPSGVSHSQTISVSHRSDDREPISHEFFALVLLCRLCNMHISLVSRVVCYDKEKSLSFACAEEAKKLATTASLKPKTLFNHATFSSKAQQPKL